MNSKTMTLLAVGLLGLPLSFVSAQVHAPDPCSAPELSLACSPSPDTTAATEAANQAEGDSREAAWQALLSGPATIWTSLNMGHGSGLDADSLDGLQADHFLNADGRLRTSIAAETAARQAADASLSSRLDRVAADQDADTLDGLDSSDFLRTRGGELTGALGIGTAARGAPLQVDSGRGQAAAIFQNSNPSHGPEIQFHALADGGNQWRIGSGQWGNAGGQGSLYFWDETHRSLRAVMTNDGRMGVGVGNPQEALHVGGTVKANAFKGDGSGLTGVDAATVGGQAPGSFATSASLSALDSEVGALATQVEDLGARVDALAGGTQTISIPMGAFMAGDSDFDWHRNTFGLFGTTPGQFIWFYAPVSLPSGAVIKEVTGIVRDTSQDLDMRVELVGTRLSDAQGLGMSNAYSSGATGVQGVTSSLNHVVNNSANTLMVAVSWTVPPRDVDLQIAAATITYELPA